MYDLNGHRTERYVTVRGRWNSSLDKWTIHDKAPTSSSNPALYDVLSHYLVRPLCCYCRPETWFQGICISIWSFQNDTNLLLSSMFLKITAKDLAFSQEELLGRKRPTRDGKGRYMYLSLEVMCLMSCVLTRLSPFLGTVCLEDGFGGRRNVDCCVRSSCAPACSW